MASFFSLGIREELGPLRTAGLWAIGAAAILAVWASLTWSQPGGVVLLSGEIYDGWVEVAPEYVSVSTTGGRYFSFDAAKVASVDAGVRPFVSPQSLPAPRRVLGALPRLYLERGLGQAAIVSLYRVTLGFAIAVALSFPLGVAMGSFRKVEALLYPLSLFGGYIPITALVPVAMALLGIGDEGRIGFLAIASFFYLLPMVAREVAAVDDIYLQTGYTLGASRWQTVAHVLVPIAMSKVYGHLRTVYGVGFTYIILAESIELTGGGLGALLYGSRRRGLMEDMYAVVLAIAALAIALDLAWGFLGKLLFPYKEEA